MRKQGTRTSFIKFANSTPTIHQAQLIVKTAIPKLNGIKEFAKELTRLKTTAIESMVQEEAIEQNSKIHSRLVKFLDSIIKKGKIEDGKDSRFILNVCNAHPNMNFTIANGKVVKGSGYLMEKTSYAISDLFEFLTDPKNIKRIKKCPLCNNFFIAEDLRRLKCNSPECIKKYEREKKRKQRDDDPVKYI